MIIALQTLIFFRESLFMIFNRWLQPYYKRFALVKEISNDDSEEEEDVHVYSDYDEEKGVVFFPPVYAQRYAAVSDCLLDERWNGKLEKIVDLGYNDISFIKYLKEVPGVKQILGVDLECTPLRCSSGLFWGEDYTPKKENPLTVTLFQGNAADPDFRLIGTDAVVAIEMIEHMLPHDLERLVHTVFGFIKPWVAIFTTPNGDFNVLFKALESNGLRRLDHFFEWSREQFHDWCSNIVNRYPDYTVSCRGIGPGPPGTIHLGCCSQMAVFVSSNYQKQMDLDPQSMTMITSLPNAGNLVGAGNWDNPAVSEKNMLSNNESYPEMVSAKASAVYLSSSTLFQLPSFECRDSMAQCNLDKELAKNFLMFDQDIQKETYQIMEPRKKSLNKVYYFEDVASRLNCTTFQVKKFSKATQNLMAMNKIDCLAHTREVLDEIKQLINMLNLQTPAIKSKDDKETIWHNINWGENAPYWNQYYKVVRDYRYPFETKSDDCRILELISDEINRLIDNQYDNVYVNINKMEIPIAHLMQVVQHITDDQDKVKDLLEWNGYEVVGDVVVHSRMILDNLSSDTFDDEWRENDTVSEWGTDLKTTSDDNSTVPELLGRCLRRALDNKVRKLRSMLTVDEDITTELEKVVCRLMKLTLKTSRGRKNPPPTKWMQCKLLDLLTLTEKAVERRRQHITDPIKAYDEDTLTVLNKIKDDMTGLDLVKKYSQIVKQKPDLTEGEYFPMEIDDITVYSNNKDLVDHSKMVQPTKTKFERTQAWVEEEIELVKYPIHNRHGQALCSTSNSVSYNEQIKLNRTTKSNLSKITSYVDKKLKNCQQSKLDGNTKYPKKVLYNKTSYLRCNIRKNPRKREIKEHKQLQSTISKPIPRSLIELCCPDNNVNKTTEKATPLCSGMLKKQEEVVVAQMIDNGINNEESYLGDIVMDGDGETSLLHGVQHHTTGTDVETDKKQSEKDTILGSVINAFNESSPEIRRSQTIFLYDINEPSTSKGLRYVCMDAQCGPDDDNECLAPTPSPLGLNATKSKHSLNNMLIDSNKSNVGSSMIENENNNYTILPKTKSVGIKIKDSDTDIVIADTVLNNVLDTNAVDVGTAIQSTIEPVQLDDQMEPETKNKTETKEFKLTTPSNDIDIASIIISRLRLCYDSLHIFNENLTIRDVAPPEQRKPIQKQKTKLEGVKKPLRHVTTRSNPIKPCLNNVRNIQQRTAVIHKLSPVTTKVSPLDSIIVPRDIEKRAIKKTQIRNPKLTIVKKRSSSRTNISDPIKGSKNVFYCGNNFSTFNIKKVTSTTASSSVFPKSASKMTKSINYTNTNSKNRVKKLPKKYLPTYLRKRLGITESIDKVNPKIESTIRMSRFDMAKNEDIHNYSEIPARHLSQFLVYRNETRKSTKEESSDRSISPVSAASSTCSSPTSVVTVKVRPRSNPKLNSDACSKSATSIKSKKTAKGRSGKINNKDDKENDPSIICSENAYMTTNDTVFIRTKLSNTPLHSTENTSTKQRKPVIPDIEKAVEKQSSVEIIKKKSIKFDTEEIEDSNNIENKEQINLEETELEYDIGKQENEWHDYSIEYPRTSTPVQEIESKELNNRLLSDLLEFNNEPPSNSYNRVDIMDIIVDMLNMVDSSSGRPRDLDSRTVLSQLSQEDLRDETFEEENRSIESAKTVVDALQNIKECNEHDDNISFDTVVANDISEDLTLTGREVLSCQTFTTTSNLSNTIQNENCDVGESHTPRTENNIHSLQSASNGSVLDLFERKETLSCPTNIGPLAIQAFSGFSVNNAPAIGDQAPDYISLFDSETGSPAMGVSRQAESEEMFISGRSSVTYVSCSMDEDTTVPDWLFRIINQPLQVQEDDLDAIAVALPEPHYDANGNVVDPLVGTDAGAGDGRGVHSDLSQDSSGQGSSLSSSDASSGPLSAMVLIDPSMLTSQFGLPPPIPLSFGSAESPMDIAEAGETLDPPARSSRDASGPLLGASDVDADESSLDTDAD